MWQIEYRGTSKTDAKDRLSKHEQIQLVPLGIIAAVNQAIDAQQKPKSGEVIYVSTSGHATVLDDAGVCCDFTNASVYVAVQDAPIEQEDAPAP